MGMIRDDSLYTQIGNLLFNFNYIDRHIDWTADANGCYNWVGARHRQGYGMVGGIQVSDDKRFMTVVHRPLMMRHLNRELTHDEFVIKNCSNMRCCNVDHYIIGDYRTQREVMKRNGRSNTCGSGHFKRAGIEYKQNRKYKYTEDQLRFLRRASIDEIVTEFNLTRAQAGAERAYARKGFKWLKD